MRLHKCVDDEGTDIYTQQQQQQQQQQEQQLVNNSFLRMVL